MFRVVVPSSVPVPELSATDTVTPEVVTALPKASRSRTVKCGEMTTPAVEVAGSCTTASWLAGPAWTTNPVRLPVLLFPSVAVSVTVWAVLSRVSMLKAPFVSALTLSP